MAGRALMRAVLAALLLVPAVASATVSFVSAGTGTGVTATTCTPGIPASAQQWDVLLVVLHSRTNTAHTCTTNCSSVGEGSTSWTVMGTQAGGTTGGRTSIWWLRRGSSFPTAPTFGGPSTESYTCQMFAFRGVIRTGNPHDVVGTYQAEAAGTTFTGDAVTTTRADSMLVFAGGSMDDNQWGTPGGGVNAVGGYTQNANGTDSSVFLAYDSSPDGTSIGSQTAPTLVQTLNGGDAGRSTTFALASDSISTALSAVSGTGAVAGVTVDIPGPITVGTPAQATGSAFSPATGLTANLSATGSGGMLIGLVNIDADSAASAFTFSNLSGAITWGTPFVQQGSGQTNYAVLVVGTTSGSVSGNITATWTQGSGNAYGSFTVVPLTSAAGLQAGTPSGATGSSSSPSITVSRAHSGYIFGGGAEWASTSSFTPTAGTNIVAPFQDSFNTMYWTLKDTGAGSTLSGTLGATSPWTMAAVEVWTTSGAALTAVTGAGTVASVTAAGGASTALSAIGGSGAVDAVTAAGSGGGAVEVALSAISSSGAVASVTPSGKGTVALSAVAGTGALTTPAVNSFTITAHASGRYLVKNGTTPFRIQAESFWSAATNLTLTEWGTYLDDRASKGINAVRVNLLQPPDGTERFSANGYPTTPDGIAQLSTPGDFSTFNATYGARLAAIVDAAAARGMVVIGNIAYTSISTAGWIDELNASTNAKCQRYGKLIAQALGGRGNLIWSLGTDNSPDATLQARLGAILDGIQNADTGQTDGSDGAGDTTRLVEFQWVASSTGRGPSTGGTEAPSTGFGAPTGLTSRSTIAPSYAQDSKYFHVSMPRSAYAASSPTLPSYLGDPVYLGKWGASWDNVIQELSWMGMLSGIAGTAHGDEAMWGAPSNWSSQLGSTVAVRAGYMAGFFSTYATGWYLLVPSNLGALAGTKLVASANSDTADGPDNAYVAAADPAGSLMVIYARSSGTGTRSVNINLSSVFSGQVKGRAYNPTSGAIQNLSGTPYTAGSSVSVTVPGDNGTSQNDWVLIFTPDTGISTALSAVTGTGAVASTTASGKASTSLSATTGSGAVASVTAGIGASSALSAVAGAGAVTSTTAAGRASLALGAVTGSGAVVSATAAGGAGSVLGALAGSGAVASVTPAGKGSVALTATAAAGALASVSVAAGGAVAVGLSAVAGTGAVTSTAQVGLANLALGSLTGTGAVAAVTLAGGAGVTLGAIPGSGVVAAVTATGQSGAQGVSFAVNPVAGAGAVGDLTAAGAAGHLLTAVAGSGAVQAVTASVVLGAQLGSLAASGVLGAVTAAGSATVALGSIGGTGALAGVTAFAGNILDAAPRLFAPIFRPIVRILVERPLLLVPVARPELPITLPR